ncbi:hypothetical protein, partial [Segatella maculosa]|uniref:hypothetical protein n=1 Tax=Segatella maculosa TaxID=439703 RepID=UPI0028D302D1
SCVRSKRRVYSLQQPRYLFVIHLARTHEPMYIDLHFQWGGRTDQCILTYIHNGADARAVRPYMPLAYKSS